MSYAHGRTTHALTLLHNPKETIMFVEIFGRYTCPYCTRAKALAEKMKAELPDFDFEFIDMPAKGIEKADLEPRVGGPVATVPQIFLDNQHVGGCTDFQALVKEKFGIEV